MFVNHNGEACFRILIIGSRDPHELVRAIHASAKEELRSELTMSGDPAWSIASFDLTFSGLRSNEHPVRATLIGHRGTGFLAASSADLKKTFVGVDAVIVRAGTDIEDDLASTTTMFASGTFPRDSIVVFDAPSGAPELAEQARARYAPRNTQTQIGENKPLDAFKLVVKAMLANQARKPH